MSGRRAEERGGSGGARARLAVSDSVDQALDMKGATVNNELYGVNGVQSVSDTFCITH